MWTWKHGNQGLNTFATYGTQGISAPGNIPAARQFGGPSWIDSEDNLWLFGGDGWAPPISTGCFSEVWKYNTTTNEWTFMNGPQGVDMLGYYGTQGVPSPTNYPPSRRESCSAWVDNNGKFWMFGGECGSYGDTTIYYNDIWKYDPVTNEWTWMRGSNTPNSIGNYGTMGVSSPTNDPPARSVHSHWIDEYGNLWFFGGGDDVSNVYNDMWKYNISTNEWTWVRGSNFPNPPDEPLAICTPSATVNPPARYENRTCWVDSCFNFWMFGGINFGADPWILYNDLWFYNVHDNTWTLAKANTTPNFGTIGTPAATNMPTYRFGAAPFKGKDGSLWIAMGRDTMFSNTPNPLGYRSHLSDIWKFVIDSICTPSTCNSLNADEYLNPDLEFNVYPNPANTSLTIDLSKYSNKDNTILKLVDIKGKILQQIKIQSNITVIDISEYSAGVYIAKLYNIDGVFVKRFIVE